MIVADLPPIEQDRILCSIKASIVYEIPTDIMLAIAEIEGGRPGIIIKNTNGTNDLGSMQFNTAYIKDLSHYGITEENVLESGCYPFYLAAWRLKQHIMHDQGSIWQKVANYHSRTKQYNLIYQRKIKIRANHWAKWLKQMQKQ